MFWGLSDHIFCFVLSHGDCTFWLSSMIYLDSLCKRKQQQKKRKIAWNEKKTGKKSIDSVLINIHNPLIIIIITITTCFFFVFNQWWVSHNQPTNQHKNLFSMVLCMESKKNTATYLIFTATKQKQIIIYRLENIG